MPGFGSLAPDMVDPLTGVPFENSPAAQAKFGRISDALLAGLRNTIEFPGNYMASGIDPEAAANWAAPMALGMVGAGGAIPVRSEGTLGIVPVDVAKRLNVKRTETQPEILTQAVENTPGAAIDPDGALRLNVRRGQSPDQEMAESVRGGVFYLPEGDKNFRHYKGTTENNYGGNQAVEGETAFVNPLVVKGATGGKAPENAFTQLHGKNAAQQLDKDVMEIVSASSWMKRKDPGAFDQLTQRFFEKYSPELANHIDYILNNSSKGNQLRYALQEAAVASAVRNAGHDGIVGYSVGRGPNKGKPNISEVFDVRENRYPSPSGDYSVWDQFQPRGGFGSLIPRQE
jgi:hypothetical protein